MDDKLFWKVLTVASILLILALSYTIVLRFIDVLVMAVLSAYIVHPLTWRVGAWGARRHGLLKRITGHHMFAPFLSFLLIVMPFVVLLLKSVSLLTDPKSTQLYLNLLYNAPQLSAKTKLILDTIGLQAFSEIIAGRVREISFSIGTVVSRQIAGIAERLIIDVPLYLISTFYFIEGGERLIKRLTGYIPPHQHFMVELVKQADEISYALFIGHFLTSIVVGLIAAGGFWLLSLAGILPLVDFIYALFLGGLVGVAVLLPVIGAWTVYIPMIIWILQTQPLAVGVPNAVKFFLFCFVFLSVIPEFIIRPQLIRSRHDVHPLIVILGFLGGPMVWGLKGFVMGPLALGLAQAAIQTYFEATINKKQ